jgi:hypothetical protein
LPHSPTFKQIVAVNCEKFCTIGMNKCYRKMHDEVIIFPGEFSENRKER